MRPAVTPTASTAPTPTRVEDILREEHLARWSPRNRKILVVEQDVWGRMLLSDALRQAGPQDVTFAESVEDALRHHDPAAFGLVIAGFDGDPEQAADLCRRIAETDPRVPVLCVAQRPEVGATEAMTELPALGALTRPTPRDLAGVIAAILRTGAPAGEERPTAERVFDLAVLGASEADVPVLRLLYRVQRMRIRLVYDPDPEAFGLSLAQNLGIPALSGELSMSLERPPDFVVLSRPDVEDRLASLGLEGVPCVTRDEVELFLVDPDSFAAGAPPAPARGIEESEDDAVEPPEHFEPEPAEPEPRGQEPPEPELHEYSPTEPEPTEPEPYDSEPSDPGVSGRGGSEPPRTLGAMAVERLPHEGETLPQDIESILGALDLLLDFERFAEKILQIALDVAGGVSGSLMVLREEERELRIVAARGLPDVVVQRTRQRIGEGVAGRVAETAEGRLLEGSLREEMRRDWDRPYLSTAVCVPVIADGRVVGVLNVNADPAGRPFDPETLREVAELGCKVGSALDRSLLLRSMRGRSFELSVRGEIERITATAEDLGSCLRAVASRIVDMMNVDVCCLWLLDPKRGRLALRAVAGAEAPGLEAMALPLGSGLVGWVARTLKPLALRSWDDGITGPDDTVTSVAVPIRHRTNLVGVLQVESTTSRMDEDRLEILSTVASVVGQQVGGLQAHESSERKVTMLSALSELGLAFSAVPEREGLCRLVTFSACTLLGSDVATMRILRPGCRPSSLSGEDYDVLGVHGASFGAAGDPLADLDACLAQEVASIRVPCRDVDVAPATIRPLLERSNVESALAVPLTSGDGELVALFTVYRVVDPRGGAPAFRDEDVEIATRLADYAAASVQRFVAPSPGWDGDDEPAFGVEPS